MKRDVFSKAFAAFLAVPLACLFLFVADGLLFHWLEESILHPDGFIVFSIVFWWFFFRIWVRPEFRRKTLVGTFPFRWALLLFLISCSGGIAFGIFGFPSAVYISAALAVVSMPCAFFGRGSKTLPFLFLLGIMPIIPQLINPVVPILQMGTSWALEIVLRGLGGQVERQGIHFDQPIRILIAPECSGIRGLWVNIFYGVFLALVYRLGIMGRWLLVGVALISALLGNFIRILCIVACGIFLGRDFVMFYAHDFIAPLMGVLIMVTTFIYISGRIRRCFPQEESWRETVPPKGYRLLFSGLIVLAWLVVSMVRPVGLVEGVKDLDCFRRIEGVGNWQRGAATVGETQECLFCFLEKESSWLGEGSFCPVCQHTKMHQEFGPTSGDDEPRFFRAVYGSLHDPQAKIAVTAGGTLSAGGESPFTWLRLQGARIIKRKVRLPLRDDGGTWLMSGAEFDLDVDAFRQEWHGTCIWGYSDGTSLYPTAWQLKLAQIRSVVRTGNAPECFIVWVYCDHAKGTNPLPTMEHFLSGFMAQVRAEDA